MHSRGIKYVEFRWLSWNSEESYQATAPTKIAENIIKHRDGHESLMVANHCDGGESSVVVTTLIISMQPHVML